MSAYAVGRVGGVGGGAALVRSHPTNAGVRQPAAVTPASCRPTACRLNLRKQILAEECRVGPERNGGCDLFGGSATRVRLQPGPGPAGGPVDSLPVAPGRLRRRVTADPLVSLQDLERQ
jgi:hypothetical protein